MAALEFIPGEGAKVGGVFLHYVELIGLPGAGKSSIAAFMERRYGWVSAREIRRRYRASLKLKERALYSLLSVAPRDQALRRLWPRFEELGSFLSRSPEAIVAFEAILSRLREDQAKVAGQLFRTFAELEAFAEHGRPGDVIIHDEGIEQRRVSLAMRGVMQHDLLTRLAPAGGSVVHVAVELRTAEARLRQRNQVRDDLAACRASLVSVLETLQGSYLTVDGEASLSEVGSQILDHCAT